MPWCRPRAAPGVTGRLRHGGVGRPAALAGARRPRLRRPGARPALARRPGAPGCCWRWRPPSRRSCGWSRWCVALVVLGLALRVSPEAVRQRSVGGPPLVALGVVPVLLLPWVASLAGRRSARAGCCSRPAGCPAADVSRWDVLAGHAGSQPAPIALGAVLAVLAVLALLPRGPADPGHRLLDRRPDGGPRGAPDLPGRGARSSAGPGGPASASSWCSCRRPS